MDSTPIFTALSTSTRQLYLLLRCIAFAHKAEVTITSDGIQFKVEEAHVVQGSTLIDKNMFSSYSVRLPEGQDAIPSFEVNITALLETLQIFGLAESTSSYKHANGGISSSYATAFSTPALNLGGTCRISYAEEGAPLSITIEESSVKTTCEMNTYELADVYGDNSEIPLDRSSLTTKIIMRSTWLYDAITELAGTNPEALVINVSASSTPFFALEGQGGPFGDSTVEFRPEGKGESTSANSRGRKQPQVTETFAVNAPSGSHGRLKQRYRFDLIKKAGRAMQLASKVSIRQDRQGVLSLQFMIDGNDGSSTAQAADGSNRGTLEASRVSFVDFRFVPLVDESDDEASTEEDDENQEDADSS